MKCKIPEISWHNRDPVLSVDIQPGSGSGNSQTYRLASGGTDAHVLIWYVNLIADGSDIELDLAADLTRHQRAVNAVKWSPNGELLASGDDESVVFIWKQKAESDPLNILDSHCEQDKEVWITMKVLRGHMEDIYDLSWSPNSQFLVSGSVDNAAMIWDVYKGKSLAILNDHKGFVQGVAWDPKNQYIATLSTDRFLRIFDIHTKRVLHRINKSSLPVGEEHELHGRRVHLFHDDTLQTFFRRLCFSPDGKLLLTPAGVVDCDGGTRPMHTTYVFSRYGFRQPALVLPCLNQYTVAVCCCPLLFRLRPHDAIKNPPVVPLPYRMIFAVATRSSVFFYDTQQPQPFAVISNIHYTRLTDITWSSDGHIMVVSSTDGFCSLITFEKGELGEEYEESEAVLKNGMFNETFNAGKKPKKSKESDAQGQKDAGNNSNEKLEKDDKRPRTPLLEAAADNWYPIVTPNRKEHSVMEIRRKFFMEESSEGSMHPDVDSPVKSDTDISLKSITIDEKSSTSQNGDDVQQPALSPISVPPILEIEKIEKSLDAILPAEVIGKVKSLSPDAVLGKKILSCDEKFASPEKKSHPATPISVRRQPRTASVLTSPRQPKVATPITVRRSPRRALLPTQLPIVAPVLTEEAMDAWPIKLSESVTAGVDKSEKSAATVKSSTNAVVNVPSSSPFKQITCDRMEDIQLVGSTIETEETDQSEVDDADKNLEQAEGEARVSSPMIVDLDQTSQETAADKTPKHKSQAESSSKTPRRVAFKTISTPKSKKKLL